MISKEKKALLHVGKTQLALTEEEYRHILKEHTGLVSSADSRFMDEDFKKVIDHFKALGFWVKRNWEQTKPRDAGDLPTVEQMRVIEHLWDDLAQYLPLRGQSPGGRGTVPINFQRGFYQKRIRISPLGPQTRAQANHVIEVLKTRVYREMQKAVAAGPRIEAKEPA